MSNLQEASLNTQSCTKPTLCPSCQTFFGSEAYKGHCSKCYKEKFEKDDSKKKEEIKIQPQEIKIESVALEKKEEEEPTKELQADHNKCWSCKRKVGALGFTCKCEYTYCKFHRMPEQHTCDFDFQKEGKEKLKHLNPVVKASKLEQI